MDKLSHLIQELNLLRKHYDLLRDQNEKFNIFTALHKKHDERRLHSRFLAVLLNPEGSHGLGHIFLAHFLERQEISFDYSRAIVFPKEHDYREYAHIDILILNKRSQQAIIIENKIYARDSNTSSGGQLERYYRYVCDEQHIPDAGISIFYLTLDGHTPSDESIAGVDLRRCVAFPTRRIYFHG